MTAVDPTVDSAELNPGDRVNKSPTGRSPGIAPPLQNVPIRTYEGQRIRQAFTDEMDSEALLNADFSQIEERIVGQYCEVNEL